MVFLVACERHTPEHEINKKLNNKNPELHQRNTIDLVLVPPPDKSKIAVEGLTQVDVGQAQVFNAPQNIRLENDAPTEGFPLGETVVTWRAVDANGQVAVATQRVIVTAQAACANEEVFFQQNISPIMQSNCIECHTENGVVSNFNLLDANTTGFIGQNYKEFQKFSILRDSNGLPLVLSKSANVNNDHGGEQIFPSTSPKYIAMQDMVSRMVSCPQNNNNLDAVVFLNPEEQLRKTTLTLADRLPTTTELNAVLAARSEADARSTIRSLLDSILNEPGFSLRIKEIFNDKLLTDAFKPDFLGLQLALDNFDNKNYFGVTELMQQGYSTLESNQLQQYASDGITQAALELIAYVIQNDLPFSQVLTANFQMVNPYSATIFSANIVGNPNFNYYYQESIPQHDPAHFLPAQLSTNKGRSIPHAGILTTQVFLGRYPSSTTNLNRKRAAKIFEVFLDTNVEGLADRTALNLIKIIGQYPTLEDPQCTVCHDVLDPVAGLFKNWNAAGRFLGNNQNWFDRRSPPQMLPPGYSINANDVLPAIDSGLALQWLAKRIVADNRFPRAIVRLMFNALVGFDLQQDPAKLEQLKSRFIASGFNMKFLIQEIVSDSYFTAKNANPLIASTEIANLGTGLLLSPERLQRKISALFTGYEWISPSKRNLLSVDSYKLLYGGIDSKTISIRTTSPTHFITGIQERLANQVACEYVPLDFNRPINTRVLFPFVEIQNSINTSAEISMVKNNIQFLYEYVLGEKYTINDAEIGRVFALFQSALSLGNPQGVSEDCRGSLELTNPIMVDSFGTVQAWMAVLNFMLRDYRFLYE